MVTVSQITPIPISQLPPATTVTGNEATAFVQGGQTVQGPLNSLPHGFTAGVIVYGNTGGSPFPNYRTLKAGGNVTFTDDGAQGDLTISASGLGVTTINGISGAVTLAAGSNVLINTVGDTITITATGGGGGGGGFISTDVAVSSGTTNVVTSVQGNILVLWNSGASGDKNQTIPTSTGSLQVITIMDFYGDSDVNPIIITPVSGYINKTLLSVEISTPGASLTFLDSLLGWILQ